MQLRQILSQKIGILSKRLVQHELARTSVARILLCEKRCGMDTRESIPYDLFKRIDEILNREEERILTSCKYAYQLSSMKIF